MYFDNGHGLLISYGMTGRWNMERTKHAKYEFVGKSENNGENKIHCYWECVRKFTSETVEYLLKTEIKKKFVKLGYDIYYDSPSDEEIIASYPPRGQNVCAFLLSQRWIGVGNYIKSVILYRCGVSPHRNTKNLSDAEKIALFAEAKKITREVIRMGGHTIESFYLDDGKTLGYYDTTPYLPKGPRHDQNGNKIKVENIGTRVTFWCPKIQK
jgi:formamidopyrimidine-DNA glycosylase